MTKVQILFVAIATVLSGCGAPMHRSTGSAGGAASLDANVGPGANRSESGGDVNGTDTANRPVGAPCEEDVQCSAGACLRMPGGYCTDLSCTPGSCGEGAVCAQIDGSQAMACLRSCSSDNDCRRGYACSSGGTCLPGDGADAGATGGPATDTSDPVPGDGSVGSSCASDADCVGPVGLARCATEAEGFFGGYCLIEECRPGSCPSGSDCFQVSEAGDSACLATCDDGCRAGYECEQGMACLPGDEAPNPDPGGGQGGAGDGAVGSACSTDGDCAAVGAVCLNEGQGFEGGYCTILQCQDGQCPQGSDCFQVAEDGTTACLDLCAGGCRSGYECVQDLACLPAEDGGTGNDGSAGAGNSPIGGACATNNDCADPGAACLSPGQGFVGGYCTIMSCEQAGCPGTSDCFQVDEEGTTLCLSACEGGCRDGYECAQDLACLPSQGAGGGGNQPPPNVDIGDAPAGNIPQCEAQMPEWRCAGGERTCGRITTFDPRLGPGYWDYPLNGETANNQYRSFLREDVVRIVKHATAGVDCLARGWDFGNFEPLGLGDMSEANGAIPGTSIGEPGHPQGTHVNGHDIDIAYYQLGTADNKLRSVCNHISGGRDQYHCVEAPNTLDVWRSALFIGLLHRSPQLRVIGVDGQIGAQIHGAIVQLCEEGWLGADNPACNGRLSLAYEVQDEGRGWYRFHHHHLHLSLAGLNQSIATDDASTYAGPDACITVDCSPVEY